MHENNDFALRRMGLEMSENLGCRAAVIGLKLFCQLASHASAGGRVYLC